jgi:tetratricopeptide (TPR) repeat protein
MKPGQKIALTITIMATMVIAGALIYGYSRGLDPFANYPFRKNFTAERLSYEKQGKSYLKRGDLDQALIYFQKAIDPKVLKDDWSGGFAKHMISDIYVFQRKYDEALEMLQGHLTVNPEKYEYRRREIIALKKFQEAGDKKVIYDHIDYRFVIDRAVLPPDGERWYEMGQIFHLYDVIGDHDAGIKLARDGLMALKNKSQKAGNDVSAYESIQTAEEARICRDSYAEHWRSCTNIYPYLLVREAFEKDKAEGTTGRPTKVIIRI